MPEKLFELVKVNYFEQTFVKLDCSSKTIQNKLFENCRFKHCNFDNSKLLNCKFVDCEFIHCTLNTIVITDTMFSQVIFEHSKLMGINWATAKWPQVKLSSLINFYSCNISHSSFFCLGLAEISMQECKAHDVDFREADLSYGNFTHTDFYQSMFIKTNLMGADFSGAVNYNIDIRLNEVKKAIFNFPDAINLLHHFGIQINGLPT
jgi:fluoroquinolone resistance protein